MRQRVKVGYCGFPRGMKHYFSRFRLVEIQQTFYKLPRIETVVRWQKAVPDDFEFTIKAWQLITHSPSSSTYRKLALAIPQGKEGCYGYFKPSDEVMEVWHMTEEITQALRAKVIVFQCPASFVSSAGNINNMRNFLNSLARNDFLFFWEPHGERSDQVVTSLCQELGLIHCVDPLQRAPLWGTTNYFRLHGDPGYRHSYTNDELEQLRQVIADKESYVLFNNITMYDDALKFVGVLGGEIG